jgi:hypothetical protein
MTSDKKLPPQKSRYARGEDRVTGKNKTKNEELITSATDTSKEVLEDGVGKLSIKGKSDLDSKADNHQKNEDKVQTLTEAFDDQPKPSKTKSDKSSLIPMAEKEALDEIKDDDSTLLPGELKPSTEDEAERVKPKVNGTAYLALAQTDAKKGATSAQEDSAVAVANDLKTPLRIFQVYYEGWQRDLLDPNFTGLDNSKSTAEAKEFSVYEQLLSSQHVKDVELWGALSWRFTEMTGLTGKDLIKAIQARPGNDIYFCNPYPQNEALYSNGWQQGETAHPQFLAMAKAIFQVTGLPLEELTSISSPELFSSTNFMVGTPRFWNAYLPWVKEVMSQANKKLPPMVRDLMHSKLADDQGLHNGATYVPFIVERLFPIFMKTRGQTLRSYKVPVPEREKELNVHLKLLREMKNVAYNSRSAWLGVCWVNYRNLYFAQVNGKDWCNKNLKAITPTDIKFS